MEFLFGFLLGLVCGVGMFMAYGYYQLSKIKKAKSKFAENLKKKLSEFGDKTESVKTRLLKAHDLTQQQLELRAQAEMPSKNALHSRHKNGLVYEIQKLEEEKIAILKSIVDDGFDPTITVLDEAGNRQELPLSSFVNHSQLKQAEEDSPTTEGDNMKRVGKFVVVKGGKDDGTVH